MNEPTTLPVPVLPDQASLSQADAGLQPPQGGSPASAPPPPPVKLDDLQWTLKEVKPGGSPGVIGFTVRFGAHSPTPAMQGWASEVADDVRQALKWQTLQRLAREPNDLGRWRAARAGLANIDSELRSLNQQQSDLGLHRAGLLGMPDGQTPEKLESLDALTGDIQGRIRRLQVTRAACERVVADLTAWAVQQIASARSAIQTESWERREAAKAELARAASAHLNAMQRCRMELSAFGTASGEVGRSVEALLDQAALEAEGS